LFWQVAVRPSAASHCRATWDDCFEDFILAELEEAKDDDDAFIFCMYQYALHIDKHLNRVEYRDPPMTGLAWVQRKPGDGKGCYRMFRMSPDMFLKLHDLFYNHMD
jgi:hypothetical protein